MKQPNYNIYPSLLDKFQKMIDSEIEVNDFWNIAEDGSYKKTEDEIRSRHEVELINMINRCPRKVIEVADKGTAFNEIIDCIIERRKSNNPEINISSVYNCNNGDVDIYGNAIERYVIAIKAEINGFVFQFDPELCKELARYYKGSLCQYLCHGTIDTKYGNVTMYGYIDEWVKDKIYDIKTTSQYNFPKFENGWQKEVYPYCVIQSGEAVNIDSFEYTVVVLSKPSSRNPIMRGKIYKEEYSYEHSRTETKLRLFLETFIAWLESRREYITDQKIFGGQNPEGYVGVEITEL